MKAVVFANGDFYPSEYILQAIKDYDFLVTADGAALYALQMKLKPDLVVGDLDSIDKEVLSLLEREKIPFARFSAEKDFTDTELALNIVVDKGATEILLLGGVGSRLDHSLCNINLLANLASNGIKCRLINEKNDCYFITKSIRLHREEGAFISIVPVGGDVLVTQTIGLYYPLKNEVLPIGSARGVSNYAINDCAQIDIGKGIAMIVVAQD